MKKYLTFTKRGDGIENLSSRADSGTGSPRQRRKRPFVGLRFRTAGLLPGVPSRDRFLNIRGDVGHYETESGAPDLNNGFHKQAQQSTGLNTPGGSPAAGWKPDPTKPARFRASIVCLLLSAACLLGAAGCSKPQEEAAADQPPPVQVTAVTEDSVRRTVSADGVLFAKNQWNVMPNITAPVARFLVNRGDAVKKDQLLAVLENRGLVANVEANKGQVEQAQANLQNTEQATIPESIVKAQTDVTSDQQQYDAAQKVFNSRQQLVTEGALPRKMAEDAGVQLAQAKAQLDTAKEHLRVLQTASKQAQIDQAKAQVTAAQGQLRSAEAQVTYSEVHSPAAGVVADRPLYPGDVAQAGTPLMVVMDVSSVVARVNVPTPDASGIKAGQDATINLADTGQDIPAKVQVVSPATDPNSSTVQVWVEAANPERRLKVGAAVHVTIVTETIKNAMLIPAAAVLPGETGGTAVLVIDSDQVAHRRAVQLGVKQGDKVQVVSGVAPREDVVTVGGLGIDDKTKVKVVQPNAPGEDDEDRPEEVPAAKKDAKGK